MTAKDKIDQATKLLQEVHLELTAGLKSERGRARGDMLRQAHNIANMLSPSQTFYSQAGQDRTVDRLLGGKRGGVFVDVGGYDGVTGSNTLFFEMFRGWSGILIEPSPVQLSRAKMVRNCPCHGLGVAGKAGSFDFMEVTAGYTQMSGFLDSYNPDLLAKLRKNPNHSEVIHKLQSKKLQTILNQASLKKIDFLSLDVEGGEVEILTNFPFEKFDIEFWSIENNTQSSTIPELMKANGYDLVEFAGVDDIYRKSKA